MYDGTGLLLTQTCTIKRWDSDEPPAQDADTGQPVLNAPIEVATLVPCRLVQVQANEVEIDRKMVVSQFDIYFPYGQDIGQHDFVTALVDDLGTTVLSEARVRTIDKNPSGGSHHTKGTLTEVKI